MSNKKYTREDFGDISIFVNSIRGAYDPTAPDPHNPTNGPSVAPKVIRPLSSYRENGQEYIDVPQADGTTVKTLKSQYNPPPPIDNNIYKDFSLRMYKYPADTSGNIIPVTKYNTETKKDEPFTIQQGPDNNGVYSSTSYYPSFNDALAQCIKYKDECYAVVIKDPGNSDSRVGSKYIFELAKKPLSNQKNEKSDSESLLCNNTYVSYIKNNREDGRSNIMPNSIPCDFSTSSVSYGGNSKVSNKSEDDTPSESKGIPSRTVKKKPIPWRIIGIVSCVIIILLIGYGIYYYRKQNTPDDASDSASDSTPELVIRTPTSKLIKKDGGYFFFV
jgi:hypothetical protein